MKEVSMQVKILTTGYCTANQKHVFPKEKSKKIKFQATCVLIQHKELGNILFDTGYSNRFFEATKYFPNRFYRWVTPVFYNEGQSCIQQLNEMGLEHSEIQHLVISHFHGDHICGLHDFPKSKLWSSKDAYDFTMSRTNLNGVVKGVLKPLLPIDLQERICFPDKVFEHIKFSKFDAWKWTDDVFFVDLPGHFKGQTGLFLKNTNLGNILLCADAAWSRKAVEQKIYPSKVVKIFVDSYSQLCHTIDLMNEFQKENPDVLILPTHCDQTAALIE